MRRTVSVTAAILVAALLAFTLSTTAGARATVSAVRLGAASQTFTSTLSYDETNHGTSHGNAVTGIVGKGNFAAMLKGSASTAVPVAAIARGGKYAVNLDVAANGNISGTAVLHLSSLPDELCFTVSIKFGKYVEGTSFPPSSGTIKTIGGTGAAATWRITAPYKLTNIGGAAIESLDTKGSTQVSTGSPESMSATCKRIAKLPS